MGITLTFTDLSQDEVDALLGVYVGGGPAPKTAKASRKVGHAAHTPPVEDDDDLDDDDLDDDGAPKKYDEATLTAMSAADIKVVAKDDFGIDIKGLKKAELVEEILAAQDEEEDDLDDDDADEDDLDDADDDLDDEDDDDDLDDEDEDDLDDDDDDDEEDEDEDEPAPRRAAKKAPAKKAVAPRRSRR